MNSVSLSSLMVMLHYLRCLAGCLNGPGIEPRTGYLVWISCEYGLLQRCDSRSSYHQHQQTPASPEQWAWIVRQALRRSIRHQVTSLPAALVASQTADLLQAGCDDVQSSHHFNAVISESTSQWADSSLVINDCIYGIVLQPAFVKRAFRCSTPAVWNAVPNSVTDSDSLAIWLDWKLLFRQDYDWQQLVCCQHLLNYNRYRNRTTVSGYFEI